MVTLKQFDGANVTPADDAALYAHFDARSGIISGCEIAHLGANQISIGSGRGLICGRSFVVEAETILATLTTSGTQQGRLLLEVDLSNPTAPIAFITQAAASLPELVQEDINNGGTVFQMQLATYTVSSTAISGLRASDALLPMIKADGSLRVTNAAQAYIFSQINAQGDRINSTISAYPTRAGVYRVSSPDVPGLPAGNAGYGVLLIVDAGSYTMHLYIDNNAVLYVYKNSSTGNYNITPPTRWYKHVGERIDAVT